MQPHLLSILPPSCISKGQQLRHKPWPFDKGDIAMEAGGLKLQQHGVESGVSSVVSQVPSLQTVLLQGEVSGVTAKNGLTIPWLCRYLCRDLDPCLPYKIMVVVWPGEVTPPLQAILTLHSQSLKSQHLPPIHISIPVLQTSVLGLKTYQVQICSSEHKLCHIIYIPLSKILHPLVLGRAKVMVNDLLRAVVLNLSSLPGQVKGGNPWT